MAVYLTKTCVAYVLKKYFPYCTVNLLVSSYGTRILGTVASDAFDNITHEERQILLDEAFNKAYHGERIDNVGPLAALTLAEYMMRLQDVYG